MYDNLNKCKDLFNQYLYLSESTIDALKEYFYLYFLNIQTIKNNEINIKLKNETKEYLNNLKFELYICNFILKNIKNININDLEFVFEILDKEFIKKYEYINSFYENLETAINMNEIRRASLPSTKYNSLAASDIILHKQYLKGFNLDNLKTFMTQEKIYLDNEFDETISKSKIFNVNSEEFIDFFALLIKKDKSDKLITLPILPKIKDDQSFLINIHELTHNALIINKEVINDEEIIDSEDLSIFYELLYKSRNNFVKTNLHITYLSNKLLNDYHNEPFLEQIEKIKFYKKNN